MSQSDRDLVAALRAELAAIDPARPCDRAAEAAGLGAGLATREAAVARLAVRLGREAGQFERLVVPRGGQKRYRVREAASEPNRPPETLAFEWLKAADHCRSAYLRGRFLARGSLSLAGARAHLEFVVDPGEAPELARRLTDVGLPAMWRLRRGRGVVTWKSGETIVTFLRRVGAGAALLELEARQVARALRGELNRVLNAESANLQRAVAAAGRQLEAIERLEADGRLALAGPLTRAVAAARRETPEATLAEIAERLEVHRSAVQRALERIEWLALDADDEDAGDRRSTRRVGHRRRLPFGGAAAASRRRAARQAAEAD